MGSSARQNQQIPDPTTAQLTAEEESLNTNQAAVPLPFGMGEQKTTLRWLTAIYYPHCKKATGSSKGK